MKRVKKISVVLFVSLLLLAGCSKKNKDEITIGVLQWAQHPALNDSLEGMMEGLKQAGLENANVQVKVVNEDASTATMAASQFVSQGVDLIFTIATPAAQTALVAVENTKIPVVFSAVTDAKAAGLVENVDSPEGAITGVSDLPPVKKQLELMKTMLPEMKKLGILFNTSEANSTSQIEEVKKIASPLGIEIVTQGISKPSELAIATAQITKSVDAIYIIPDNTIASQAGLVVNQASELKVPVFMAESGQFDQGILATDSISYKSLGIQAGIMIKEILVDKKPIQSIPVQTAQETELIISQKMADELGIQIPKELIERAEIR